MANAAEVDFAFRFLLGRAPTAMQLAAWQAVPAEALRLSLMATPDFRSALPADSVLLPLDRPPPSIVWQVDGPTASAMLARVQASWVRLGVERPHWSVEPRPEFEPDRIAANRAVFEATGDADVAVLLAVLARHGTAAQAFPHAFEYGCGVGRVSRPMAGAFAALTVCDISPPHLALARAAAGARVTYSLAALPEFGMTRPFDLWFSIATLQANPPPIIALILQRMFAMLAPGGVALFQLPTEMLGYRFDPAAYLAAPDNPASEIHILPQPVVFALAAQAGCVPLEVRQDGRVWPPTACTSNFFVFTKPRPRWPTL